MTTSTVSNNALEMVSTENLIFDILDDAGDRLKKSKANGARQVKHTLRFGRSGVWVAPTFEQLAEESLANGRLGYTYTN